MQDVPLSISSILKHGRDVYGDSSIITVGEGGNRRATFTEVSATPRGSRTALRSLGIEGDARVGTFMWNNQEHMEAYLAIPSMGAVLHTLNIRLFPEQVSYIATHAEDQVVIADALAAAAARALHQRHADRAHGRRHRRRRHVSDRGGRQADRVATPTCSRGGETSYDWPDVDERYAAAMCYTSGTTGNPKGVVYSHRSMWLHSQAACTNNSLGLSAQDIALVIVPQFHANAWGIPYAAFMAGADLVMPDRFLQAEPLVRAIEAEKPTMSGAVPTIWNDILNYLRANPGHDISSIERIICGGSAVPRALMQAFDEELGITIIQAWGMTETSPLGSVAKPPRGLSAEAAWDYRCTAGRFAFGVEGRIVDDAGEVMPRDGKAVGELEVRGPVGHCGVPQGRRPGEVRQRLAAHRRRRHDRPAWLHHVDRPREGRHQERWRVDLLGRARGHADGAPRDPRGGRRRGAGRALAGATARCGRAARGQVGDGRGAADLARRPGREVVGAGAVGLHRRGAQDQRRQVRQEGAAQGLQRRRDNGGDAINCWDFRGNLTGGGGVVRTWMRGLPTTCGGSGRRWFATRRCCVVTR